MSRVYNFSAGPAVLPEEVLKEVAEEMMDYQGTGMSVMEMSHRSAAFQEIIDTAEKDLRELMNIPDNYKVLFLQGGASQQFAMIPMNLMKNKVADYIVTGQWAKKAYQEAQKYGKVNKIATSEDKTFSYIPDCSDLDIPEDADYVYICENNTIYGTEIRKELDSPVQMVADMSSDILSRPVDVSKYAIIYGGAQKNLSMAGVTFVIVKEDALGKVSRQIPTMLDYRTHVEKGSMFNTPPVVPVFTALQTMKWIKAQGGVKVMDARAKERAEILYSEIDRNKLFRGTVAEEDRSLMNICFVMNDEYKELEADFMKFATDKGMVGIKGHRSVGGFRASCYNAMSVEGVKALVEAMKEFEAAH